MELRRIGFLQRDIVVIGASAGGVEALCRLAADLPSNLAAAVLVVVHTGANSSMLPSVLARAGPLPAAYAQDGEALRQAQWIIAPPGRHLVIENGVLRLTNTAKRRFNRPAIDCLFESAAREFGSRVIGILLTGYLSDGTAGLRAIKGFGGLVIIQDPATAYAPDMPASALQSVAADYLLPLEQIGPQLIKLIQHGAESDAGSTTT